MKHASIYYSIDQNELLLIWCDKRSLLKLFNTELSRIDENLVFISYL